MKKQGRKYINTLLGLLIFLELMLVNFSEANEGSIHYYWAKTYGKDNYDRVNDVAILSDGSIIAVGEHHESLTEYKPFIMKLSPEGDVIWAKFYEMAWSSTATAVSVAPNGDIVVAGQFRFVDDMDINEYEIWVLKLDSKGNIKWQKTYGREIHDDKVNGLAVTQNGDIIVTGSLTMRIDSMGNLIWVNNISGIGVLTLPTGDIVIASETYTKNSNEDIRITLLDENGNVKWQKNYGGPRYDSPSALLLTPDNNIIVVGNTNSFESGPEDGAIGTILENGLVVKLSLDGEILWQKTYGGPSYDHFSDAAVTSTGEIIVTGSSDSFGIGLYDVWLLKINENGDIIWQKTYGAQSSEGAESVAIFPDKSIIIAGYSNSFGVHNLDCWILHVPPDGDLPNCNICGAATAQSSDSNLTIKQLPLITSNVNITVKRVNGQLKPWDVMEKIQYSYTAQGTLKLLSHPTGAKVYINGTYMGRTPLTIDLPVSVYRAILSLENYSNYTTNVTISPGELKVISVTLTPKYSYINIYSSPTNSEVYIDMEYAGTTPLSNYKLVPGYHTIEIKKGEYSPYTTTVYLSAGEIKNITVSLIPQFGILNVSSNILGSEVFIDDRKIGTTPIENYKLPIGFHTVRVTKEGYSSSIQNITVEPGKELRITANLSSIYAFLNVYSEVQGANVYLDGQPIGKTPIEEYKLPAGNHTLKVKVEGYKVFSQNITVEPAKTLTINATLVPLPTQTSLQSSPAHIYSTTTTSYLPYAGASIFGLLVITLLLTRKRRKILLVPDFPHQLLKKYEPLEFLGEGGFAKVFKVKRKKDKKIIALKVFLTNEKAKKFFTKEVKAWKLLDHPNIVKLYNAFEEPIPHLEIEFIEGYILDGKLIRDLDNYPKPVNEELALKFIEGIAEGLRHAHAKQVYHRDLKPSNILLKSDLTPKITDFGLAKVGSKSTTTTTKALTPLYAAPEQIDEKTYGHTDHRTDIYQLGVILYELLTGKLPYGGSSHVVVLAKITNPGIKPKPPSSYNLTLAKYDRMFEKLLAKQKEQRYQSLDEFLEEFRGLVELIKEKEKLKESLKLTKDTITKTMDELEVRRLNSELLRLLVQNAILSARINDKEEVLNTLYDLLPFTREHRAELEEAIRQVQVFIQESLFIPEGFIDSLRILLHKIEKEASN